jgi:hypothetical protein
LFELYKSCWIGKGVTMSSDYAPVALFAYARLPHLQQTIASLLANPESRSTRLYVFCDGPKHEGHRAQVDAVRAFIDTIEGFASITRVYRDKNLGLARSIIGGVSDVLERHGSVIVVEDDLVVSQHFLRFMNEGLRLYRDDQQVASIHGYCYPVAEPLPETFFLRGADCWGWATWSRAWTHFESDGQRLLDELKRTKLNRGFDLDGAYAFTRMLRNQVAGKNDSWAVRWHASCFLKGMLTLYPGRSLVNNIGNDDSGTHCAATDDFLQTVATTPVSVVRIDLKESPVARASFIRFLGAHTAVLERARRGMTRLLKKWSWS